MKPIALGFVGDNECKDILSYSRLAERNGYDSVWLSEDLGFRDAITPLASLAMSTNRIQKSLKGNGRIHIHSSTASEWKVAHF